VSFLGVECNSFINAEHGEVMSDFLKKKHIFIVHASHDAELVNEFKTMLEVSLRNSDFSEKVKIITMYDFPQSGQSHYVSNEEAIKRSDIFISLFSPAFMLSPTIMKREHPAIENIIDKDNRNKAYFRVRLLPLPNGYGDNVFLQEANFFRSTAASKLDFFGKDLGLHTRSQRQLFVEELVQKIAPFLTSNSDITDARNIPHIDDFIKGKNRKLRICKKNDILLSASYLMKNVYPPVRHLLVINDNESLYGLISIRDIYRFNFKDQVSEISNLVFLNETALSTKVSDLSIPLEKMSYISLSNENKLSNVIQEFIRSPKTGKPIGILPVIKKDGDFSKGQYEIISYIDILKIWQQLPGSSELSKMTADSFEKQPRIEVVYKNTPILVAFEKLNKGIRSIPVLESTDTDAKLVGMISDTKLMDLSQDEVRNSVSTIMTENYPRISSSTRFSKLVDIFISNKELTSLPVLNEMGGIEKLIGYTDILRHIRNALIKHERRSS